MWFRLYSKLWGPNVPTKRAISKIPVLVGTFLGTHEEPTTTKNINCNWILPIKDLAIIVNFNLTLTGIAYVIDY